MKNYIYILIIFASLLTACYPKYQAELAHAELLLEAQPDSALSILNTINGKRIYNNAEHAHYALLYTMALDKNGIDSQNSNDSLISIATDYYATHGADSIKALAYYYRGRVYENANNANQSIEYFTLAQEYVPNTNHRTKGLIYSSLGALYQAQRNHTKAIEQFNIAAEAFANANSKTNQAIALASIATNYNILKDLTKALQYQHKALDIYIAANDTAGILRSHRGLVSAKMHGGYPLEPLVNELIAVFEQYNGGKVPPSAYALMCSIYINMKNADMARHYLNLYLKHNGETVHNSQYANMQLSDIEKAKGNYLKALEYKDKNIALIDSTYRSRLKHTVEEVSQRYNNQILKQRLADEENKKQITNTIYIAIILVVLLAAAIVYIIQQSKVIASERKLIDYKQQVDILEEIERKLHFQHSELSAELAQQKQSAQQYANNETILQEQLNKLLVSIKKDAGIIDEINSVTVEIGSLLSNVPAISNSKVGKSINTFINKITSNSESNTLLSLINYTVNKKYNGLIPHLTEHYKLSAADINLYCMICLGYTNAAIGLILQHKNTGSLYNNRSRLSKKLNIYDKDIKLDDYILELSEKFESKEKQQ